MVNNMGLPVVIVTNNVFGLALEPGISSAEIFIVPDVPEMLPVPVPLHLVELKDVMVNDTGVPPKLTLIVPPVRTPGAA